MAENNNREFLSGDIVKLKKYFYVLRPVLACRWILNRNSQPPMLFSELVKEELPKDIESDVQRLLEIKINTPEVKEINRVEKVNKYLENSIADIKQTLSCLPPEEDRQWNVLNKMFLSALDLYSKQT